MCIYDCGYISVEVMNSGFRQPGMGPGDPFGNDRGIIMRSPFEQDLRSLRDMPNRPDSAST